MAHHRRVMRTLECGQANLWEMNAHHCLDPPTPVSKELCDREEHADHADV